MDSYLNMSTESTTGFSYAIFTTNNFFPLQLIFLKYYPIMVIPLFRKKKLYKIKLFSNKNNLYKLFIIYITYYNRSIIYTK